MVVPPAIRLGTGIAGVGLLCVSASMILLPDLMIGIWPWPLTPATCLSIGGWLAAPGVGYLLLAFEPRWSGWRILLQHQALAVGLILLAVPRAWNEFNPANPVASAVWPHLGWRSVWSVWDRREPVSAPS